MQKIGELPGSWRVRHGRIPPELAKTFFDQVMEMATKDPSPVRVARRLSELNSMSLSPGTIRHWIVGDRKPQGINVYRNVFREEPSPALSYIIGANKGDGCTMTKSGIVKLEVTDKDFAQAFNVNMAILFSRERLNKILVRSRPNRLPMYIVKYSSRQLVRFLRQPLEKLLSFASAFAREFLRGFFDAEGHVGVSVGNEFHLTIGADNTNWSLLLQARRLLELLCIRARMERKRGAGSIMKIRGETFAKRRTSFSLVIGKIDDIKRFRFNVGFNIFRKIRKLDDAISIIQAIEPKDRPREWMRHYKKVGGEWIRREFH